MNISLECKAFRKALKFIFLGVAISMAGFTACKDDPAGNTDVEVTASFTYDPQHPKAGDVVTLNAETSTATDGAPDFAWELSAPAGSQAEIDNPSSHTATFRVDEAGDYHITLTVTSGGVSDTENATIKALPPVEEISGYIDSDRTLPGNTHYRVVGDLTVRNGATLTIEPGVVMEFESETALQITNDARLSAIGTEQDSIRFTGTTKTAGWWDGIYLYNATHPDNQMDYAVVEYGGGNAFHNSVAPGNLVIGRSSYSAAISVNNSTFRQSGGVGVSIHAGAKMPGSANNTYTKNADGAAGVYASSMHYLDSSSSYTGNAEGADYVIVDGNTLEENATWQALDVPYAIYDNVVVTDARLTIEAGAEFAFDAQTGLTLGSESITQANGTENSPIIFTGLTKEAGWWNGIYVFNTTHPDNLLDGIVVEYAGGEAFTTSTEPANLTVGRSSYSSSVTVKNSTFRNSKGVGMFVHASSDIPGSEINTYTGNDEGPVSFPTSKIHYLDNNSTFTGNASGTDYAIVRGNTLEDDATWQPLDVPYGMKGKSQIKTAELTIEPGAQFAFDAQARLEFGEESVIQLIGTDEKEILFTGMREEAGWWDGIFVFDTTHPDNTMEYVTIEYAGRVQMHSSSDPANLVVGRSSYPAHLSVTNSTFRNSNDTGLYIHSQSTTNADVCSANNFSGNGGTDCSDNQ